MQSKNPAGTTGIEIVSATRDWIRLMVRCEIKTAERLMQFLHEVMELPYLEKETVAIALRELLMNAIEHGGKLDPEKYVEISYLRTRRAVSCRIKDPGTLPLAMAGALVGRLRPNSPHSSRRPRKA